MGPIRQAQGRQGTRLQERKLESIKYPIFNFRFAIFEC